MSSAAMATAAIAVTTVIIRMGATAVPTVIIRTVVIDRGPGAMAMAVSGAVGQRRISMDTNGPVMRNRRGRQGLFRMRATTDLVLLP